MEEEKIFAPLLMTQLNVRHADDDAAQNLIKKLHCVFPFCSEKIMGPFSRWKAVEKAFQSILFSTGKVNTCKESLAHLDA